MRAKLVYSGVLFRILSILLFLIYPLVLIFLAFNSNAQINLTVDKLEVGDMLAILIGIMSFILVIVTLFFLWKELSLQRDLKNFDSVKQYIFSHNLYVTRAFNMRGSIVRHGLDCLHEEMGEEDPIEKLDSDTALTQLMMIHGDADRITSQLLGFLYSSDSSGLVAGLKQIENDLSSCGEEFETEYPILISTLAKILWLKKNESDTESKYSELSRSYDQCLVALTNHARDGVGLDEQSFKREFQRELSVFDMSFSVMNSNQTL